jgi:1,4-alpha-glucan branching enzyme
VSIGSGGSSGADRGAALSELDLHLLGEGTHYHLWERLGAHVLGGGAGVRFAVWAPNAREVAVVGDFNDWTTDAAPLAPRGDSGVWEGVVPGARSGQAYKFRLRTPGDAWVDRADPLARRTEAPPRTASVIHEDDYAWRDGAWMEGRAARNALDAPMSIYELHPGSWMRRPEEGDRRLGWRELAELLPDYAVRHGFTHVELLPVMEHPFYGSWGYQVTGYFAPSARYGPPEDLKLLVDRLHEVGIGVLLDWVPSHFPADEFALARFDGTHLYEHADPRRGHHPDWDSLIFNYGRHEVRAFLVSSALYWLEEFHADGLRVDAVASMLYLDYSREEGEWLPNERGGRENLEAVDFLQRLNTEAYRRCPGIQMVAEESTAWPGVTRPADAGGLGFGLKWDMGWMHDILRYMSRDPVHRRWHHSDLTFRQLYAFTENFVLAFSHDEVVHGKGSLLGRMAGDRWQKFANLRLLYGSMFAQPGKKLLFMGDEFAQEREWNHETSLDWHLLDEPEHGGMLRWVGDLNALYRDEPALHELDCDPGGFEWVAPDDDLQNVISFLRRSRDGGRCVLGVFNFSPVERTGYRVGVPRPGPWVERLNSDAGLYGGSGRGNLGRAEAVAEPCHGAPWSLSLTLPPLAAVFLQPAAQLPEGRP